MSLKNSSNSENYLMQREYLLRQRGAQDWVANRIFSENGIIGGREFQIRQSVKISSSFEEILFF